MRSLVIGMCVMLVALAAPLATAQSWGDWDSPSQDPNQPYEGGADATNPDCIGVIEAGEEPPAMPVPNGSGNVFCMDARTKSVPLIVLFTFTCPVDNGVCQVSYDYSAYGTIFGGGGFSVFVDSGGDYSNADDNWSPIGLPPQFTFGGNTEGAGACDGDSHTIEFKVEPGTLLYIDNGAVVCSTGGPTPIEDSTWGTIKSKYHTP